MTTIAVLTTIDSLEQARTISSALVERGLAACAQISEIESFYTWQGETQNDREFRILIKTTEERFPEIEATIQDLHSYDLPAICAFAMDHVSGPFAEWITDCVS